MSADTYHSFVMMCVVIAITGAVVASTSMVTVTLSLAHPLVLWGWAVPSLIMTPFIIWRIIARSCIKDDGLTFGHFLFRDTYLPACGFTFLHILMYVALAYLPLLNLAYVLAGIVSVMRCEFSLNCSRIFTRQH